MTHIFHVVAMSSPDDHYSLLMALKQSEKVVRILCVWNIRAQVYISDCQERNVMKIVLFVQNVFAAGWWRSCWTLQQSKWHDIRVTCVTNVKSWVRNDEKKATSSISFVDLKLFHAIFLLFHSTTFSVQSGGMRDHFEPFTLHNVVNYTDPEFYWTNEQVTDFYK